MLWEDKFHLSAGSKPLAGMVYGEILVNYSPIRVVRREDQLCEVFDPWGGLALYSFIWELSLLYRYRPLFILLSLSAGDKHALTSCMWESQYGDMPCEWIRSAFGDHMWGYPYECPSQWESQHRDSSLHPWYNLKSLTTYSLFRSYFQLLECVIQERNQKLFSILGVIAGVINVIEHMTESWTNSL